MTTSHAITANVALIHVSLYACNSDAKFINTKIAAQFHMISAILNDANGLIGTTKVLINC